MAIFILLILQFTDTNTYLTALPLCKQLSRSNVGLVFTVLLHKYVQVLLKYKNTPNTEKAIKHKLHYIHLQNITIDITYILNIVSLSK